MNSRKNSLIGLASESDLRIALYYEEAFNVLYKSEQYEDHIVIPALFLVRQFLELGFKYNIKKLYSISKSTCLLESLSNEHNLDKLYNAFIQHYTLAKSNLKLRGLKDGNLLSDLKSLVNLIIPLDNNSMGFRYSNDKDGNKQIGLDETYNLENVSILLKNVSNLLSGTEELFGLTT